MGTARPDTEALWLRLQGTPGWGRAWKAELEPQRPGFLVEGERDPRKSLNQGVNHLMSILKGPVRLTGHG